MEERKKAYRQQGKQKTITTVSGKVTVVPGGGSNFRPGSGVVAGNKIYHGGIVEQNEQGRSTRGE